MAIIAILATITFTITTGVRERGRRAQAKAELAVLASALEQYRNQYGDYPQIPTTFSAAGPIVSSAIADTNAESKLFNALFGVLGPEMTDIEVVDPENPSADPTLGRVFVQAAKLQFENESETDFPDTQGEEDANAILDPWGQRYQYFYKTTAGWTFVGYVLCSAGADGLVTAPTAAGDPQYAATANADNIYPNRD
jgi:type II secretory pathway pseudopilin PulG